MVQKLMNLKKMKSRLALGVSVAVIGIGIAAGGLLFLKENHASAAPANFVYRSGNKMMLNGAEYKFVGFNAYGMTGCETGTPWNQTQIDAYFKSLPPASMTRIWAFKERSSNLDLVVARAEANNQKLVMTLGNGLHNCEGSTFYSGSDTGESMHAPWFQSTYKGPWMDWVKTAVNKYKNSAAVGMWEVSNEGGHPDNISASIMKPYYDDVSATIKGLDSQHLVSTGALAEYTYGGEAGYQQIHSSNNIDVVSFHEYDGGTISGHFPSVLKVAKALNKPLMVGETGSPDSNLCGQARADYLKARFDAYLGQGAAGVLIWNRSLQNCGGWSVGPGDVTANMVTNYKIPGIVATPPTTPPPTTPPPTTPPPTTPTTGCTTNNAYGSATSTLNVPTAGSYRIWSRISVPDATNNSYMLEIDGNSCYVVGDTSLSANTWTWVDYQNGTNNSKINATLSAGNHTLKLIGREVNVKVDKVMAIADQNCIPKDLGDISQCAAAGDTTLPTVTITAPADGSTVNGKVNITANATDDKAVSKVEFLVQNVVKATDTTAPYAYEWDTTVQTNGSYAVTAKAYDASGNAASDTNTAIVKNGDTQAPTVPANVKATANAHNRVTVTWQASTDNTGVTGYWVSRNGVVVGTLGNTTTFTDTGVTGGTQYAYQITAFDAASNKSAASAATSVTTPPVQTADTQTPSKPSQLVANAVSKSQINLSWSQSTDNVGVKQYDVFRGIGQGTPIQVGSTTQTTYGDTNLSSNTSYTYHVVARDAAGNTAKSDTASAKTAAEQPQQEAKSTLRGSVQTRSGRPIPGARVTLWVNDRRYTATTNWRGQYIITNIPSGRYDVYFRAYGFDRYNDRIRLNPGKTKWYDVQLRR